MTEAVDENELKICILMQMKNLKISQAFIVQVMKAQRLLLEAFQV